FLPSGFSGDAAALTASLTQHAGERDFSLPEGDAASDLLSNPRSDAMLVNLRHRFRQGFEAYVDALILGNRGESTDRSRYAEGFLTRAPPPNPFIDLTLVTYPFSTIETRIRPRLDNSRYTIGVVGELPFGWRGTVEASVGWLRYETSQSTEIASPIVL